MIRFANRMFQPVRGFLGRQSPTVLGVSAAAALLLAVLAVLFIYPGTLREREVATRPDEQSLAAAQRLRVAEVVARLELLKALVVARRPDNELERYRHLIETELETVYGHASFPQAQWAPIEAELNSLVVQLGDDPEGAIVRIDALIERLAPTLP